MDLDTYYENAELKLNYNWVEINWNWATIQGQ